MITHIDNHGFSLIELMIAITIISILSALSFPLYTTHVHHTQRIEAEITLTKLASALEEYFIKNNSYQNADLNQLSFEEPITKHHYHFNIALANAEHYLITATPPSPDTECGILTLSETGEKTISGNSSLSSCW